MPKKRKSGVSLKGHPLPSRPAPLSYEYLSDRVTVKRASHSRFHLIAHACRPSIPSSVRQHQKHLTKSAEPCLSAKLPLLAQYIVPFVYQILSDESAHLLSPLGWHRSPPKTGCPQIPLPE